tara:strand:+ start:12481 stop:12876 length:396 start_codon:yes stop_codon:yes gene_type:complete
MNSFTQLAQAVRGAQWSDANRVFAEIMQQKVTDRLQQERQTIFKEEAKAVACAACGEPEYADKGWKTKDGLVCRACYADKPRLASAYPKSVSEAKSMRFKCLMAKCKKTFYSTEEEPSCPACGAGYEDIEG